jgi:hypothetical protein
MQQENNELDKEVLKAVSKIVTMRELLDDIYSYLFDMYGEANIDSGSRSGDLMKRYEKLMENESQNRRRCTK